MTNISGCRITPCSSRGQRVGALGLTLALTVVLSPSPESRARQGVGAHRTEIAGGSRGPSLEEIKLLERECFDEVNKYRTFQGLDPLEFDGEVLVVARAHSRRMADEQFFSHTDGAGKTVRERLEQARIRWRSVGENIASSKGYFNPVAAAIHGWLGSQGHRRNILAPGFRSAAVGAWIGDDGTVYFTQIFMTK